MDKIGVFHANQAFNVFFCGPFTLFLSCVCYAFARACLLMPCGHLLGKG